MFGRMYIKHKVDQGALQPRTQAAHHIKARAGYLCATLKINEMQPLTNLPMRRRLMRKICRRAPAAYLDILRLARAFWHAFMRKIGKLKQQGMQRTVDAGNLNFKLSDLIPGGLQRRSQSLALCWWRVADDLSQGLILLPGPRAQRFAACDQSTPFLSQRQRLFQRSRHITLAQRCAQ